MITKDNRTPEQVKSHIWGIVARDAAMSYEGEAKGGTSRCAWAVDERTGVNPDRVFNWVKSRSEMKNVSFVDLSTYRPPSNTAHFHIYVVTANHPAAKY